MWPMPPRSATIPIPTASSSLATAEGVKTDLMLRVPGRLPGLYLIETDAKGERRFYYWRDERAGARTVRTRRTGTASPRACSARG